MEDPTSQNSGVPAVEPSASAVVPPVPPPAPSVPLQSSPAAPAVVTPPVAVPVASPVVREDQVQNAVGFLSHPQVRSSTNVASKRSFLERKGLTAAEIDEAFRRVPEQPASATPAATPAPPTGPQPAAYAPQPSPQQPQLTQQPYAAAVTAPGTQLVAAQPAAPTTLVPQIAPGYRWSQLVLGVGAVVAAGWALHQLVLPRLRSMVDSWQVQRRDAEEARHKELHDAVTSLKGCQEELKASTQALLETVTLMREQQRAGIIDGAPLIRGPVAGRDSDYNGRNDTPYGGVGNSSLTLGADNYAALRAAAGYTNAYPPDPPSYTVSYPYGRGDSTPATAGPTGGDGSRSGTGPYGMPNPPYGSVRSAAANPYGGGPGRQQQQENLPYRVTAPPSPAHSTHSMQSGRQPQQQQPPTGILGSASGPYGSSDRLYDQSLPGGGRTAGSAPFPSGGPAIGGAGGATAAGTDGRTVPRPPPEQPVYPQSFHEVMEMVQQGITPPNVRTDINDTPPDPTCPLSEARMPAPLKPWERSAGAPGASSISANGSGSSGSGALSAPMGSSYSVPMGQTLPPTTYGMPSPTASGGTATASGSMAGGASSSGTGRVSSSGAAAGGSGRTVLPPANPTWRPPPPPTRTVVPSNPTSPPSSSLTWMASGSGGGEAGTSAAAAAAPPAAAPVAPAAGAAAMPAAAALPQLAAEFPEHVMALAGPPSPSPSQPAFAASAAELTRTPDGPSTSGTPAGPGPSAFAAAAASASPPPPASPAPPPPVAVDEAASPGGGAGAGDVVTSSMSAPLGISTPRMLSPDDFHIGQSAGAKQPEEQQHNCAFMIALIGELFSLWTFYMPTVTRQGP